MLLCVALVLSGALLVTIDAVLATPLRDLLTELCDGEGRARFWVVTTRIAIATCVLLAVALSVSAASGSRSVSGVARPLRSAGAAALLGLSAVAGMVPAFERRSGRDA